MQTDVISKKENYNNNNLCNLYVCWDAHPPNFAAETVV